MASPQVLAPAQLPAEVRAFTGRTAELTALDGLLAAAPTPPVCLVTGLGGVGKTALVVRWAHRVRDEFPDGQLYLNLRGYDPGRPVPAGTALAGFLHALGAGPDIPLDTEARSGAYRTLLAGRRMLVVLDNASSAAQVRPLLTGTSTVVTVITSRDQLTPLATDGARTVQLGPLTTAESRALLAGRIGATQVAAEPAAVGQIAAACAGLPLALSVVAARAVTNPAFPLSAVAADLASADRRLGALTAGDGPSDVHTVLSWSYEGQPALDARIWRQLSLHPGPDLTAPAAASLTGLPLAAVRPSLFALAQANLLTEHRPGRYAFHDLLREYATELARGTDAGPQRDAAARRLLGYYAHTAHAAARRLQPARDPIPLPLSRPMPGAGPEFFDGADQAWDWFSAERQVLMSVQRLAADTGHHTTAWQLAWSLSTYLRRATYLPDRIAAWRIALTAAQQLADPAAQAYAHRMLAQSLVRAGADAAEVDGHLESALALHEQAGDRAAEGDTLATLSYIWAGRGRTDRALEFSRRALACHESAGNRTGQYTAVNEIAANLVELGRYTEALGWCDRALAIQQEIGTAESGALWDTFGIAHHHLGEHDRAIGYYQRALEQLRVNGDRYEEAETLTRLGDTLLAAGRRDEARASWEQALATFTELDHPGAAGARAKLAQLAGA